MDAERVGEIEVGGASHIGDGWRICDSCARPFLPLTDLDTAFLWASALMLLSSFAAWLIMRRTGILR